MWTTGCRAESSTLVSFVTLLALAFRAIGVAARARGAVGRTPWAQNLWCWGIGCGLFAHATAFISVSLLRTDEDPVLSLPHADRGGVLVRPRGERAKCGADAECDGVAERLADRVTSRRAVSDESIVLNGPQTLRRRRSAPGDRLCRRHALVLPVERDLGALLLAGRALPNTLTANSSAPLRADVGAPSGVAFGEAEQLRGPRVPRRVANGRASQLRGVPSPPSSRLARDQLGRSRPGRERSGRRDAYRRTSGKSELTTGRPSARYSLSLIGLQLRIHSLSRHGMIATSKPAP